MREEKWVARKDILEAVVNKAVWQKTTIQSLF